MVVTESVANLDAHKHLQVDLVGDRELVKVVEGVKENMVRLDAEISLWQFKIKTTLEMNLEAMFAKKRKVMLKWQNYSRKARRYNR